MLDCQLVACNQFSDGFIAVPSVECPSVLAPGPVTTGSSACVVGRPGIGRKVIDGASQSAVADPEQGWKNLVF